MVRACSKVHSHDQRGRWLYEACWHRVNLAANSSATVGESRWRLCLQRHRRRKGQPQFRRHTGAGRHRAGALPRQAHRGRRSVAACRGGDQRCRHGAIVGAGTPCGGAGPRARGQRRRRPRRHGLPGDVAAGPSVPRDARGRSPRAHGLNGGAGRLAGHRGLGSAQDHGHRAGSAQDQQAIRSCKPGSAESPRCPLGGGKGDPQ
mmetsp:Transcript_141234/g.393615  ORF Transcript_141234/g.393615 Transcript_141234/m.393615 type:complete len:204 (-) Transcript_141234:653-1264(-)